VVVVQNSTGDFASEFPPPGTNCNLIPSHSYTFSGRVVGRGGEGSCSVSYTTPDPPPPPPPGSGTPTPVIPPFPASPPPSAPTPETPDPEPVSVPTCTDPKTETVVSSSAGTDFTGDYVCDSIRIDSPCDKSVYETRKTYTSTGKVVTPCE
jgi:hypothetical protein